MALKFPEKNAHGFLSMFTRKSQVMPENVSTLSLSLYICVYICIYTHIYYIYAIYNKHIYIHMHSYTYTCVCVCVCASIFVASLSGIAVTRPCFMSAVPGAQQKTSAVAQEALQKP